MADHLDPSDDRNVQVLVKRMWAAITSYIDQSSFDDALSNEPAQPNESMKQFLEAVARDLLAQVDADRAADLWGVN